VPCCTINVATGPRPASRFASRLALDPRRQLLDLRHQHDLLEQGFDPRPLQRRDLDEDRVAAPRLGHQLALGELLHDALGVGLLAVDLVDGDDDRHVGRLGMVDGLDRLGHDAVVGRHHQNHDVRHLRPTRPHRGERGVAGRVDERDRVVLPVHLVGADVLRDAAGLAGHDVGGADLVEQQRLAVVDVAHDGDDRRARPLVGLVLFVLVLEVPGQELGLLLLAGVDQTHVGADLGREQLDHVVAQRLRGHDHLALQQQEAHDVARAAIELGPEVARGRAALDDDLALGHRRRRRLVRRELRRLELFEVAPASPRPTLRGPPPRHAPTSSLGRGTGRGTRARAPAEAATRAAAEATATARATTGTPAAPGGPATGALRVGATAAARAGTRGCVRRGPAPAHAGRGRDGPAARSERRPLPGRRGHGPARWAQWGSGPALVGWGGRFRCVRSRRMGSRRRLGGRGRRTVARGRGSGRGGRTLGRPAADQA
jgi:hypothetical protein